MRRRARTNVHHSCAGGRVARSLSAIRLADALRTSALGVRDMRIMLVIVTLAIVLPWHIKPAVQQEAIPFVGCPADVQGEDVPPPQGLGAGIAAPGPDQLEGA